MIIFDIALSRSFADAIKNIAVDIMEESIKLNKVSKEVEAAWVSQASSEYCEKLRNLMKKMQNTAYDLNGVSKKINGYVDAMIEADKEAAAIIGGGSSGGSPSSSSPSGSGVIDRYKAKDYSDQGIAGTTGYEIKGNPNSPYYQNDPSGGDPSVDQYNDNSGWVSCTFMTLYQLHSKGLGYPFEHIGGTNGGQWFDNYAGAPENRYTGVDGFRQMIAEYMASDQTEPLRNVVVSFDSGQYGHVMLIDGIHKNGEITFRDNSWGDGFGTRLYAEYDSAEGFTTDAAMKAVDNAPVHGMQVEEFLRHYGYMHMNGAVIIGNN